MINPLYLPELREMLAENNSAELREFCMALHPARTAEFMEGLNADEAWQVLKHADAATRVQVFSYFDREMQREIIETSDRREIGHLIADLPADDRVDLLNVVAPHVVEELLPLIPHEDRRDILRLGSYPEGTAGALMTSQFARLPESMTVRQALDEIGRQSEQLETIYYIYIVDEKGHLRGLVSARQLVSSLGKPEMPIRDLMERDLVTVSVTDHQEHTAEKVAQYDLLAIPVVDDEYHLLGIITHDDVIDVFQEEATEDAQRLGAVNPLEQSYFQTSWPTLTWKRGIWMIILFFAAVCTILTLNAYANDLARPGLQWLVFFIPLVISSGGNCGSQSATLIVTALKTGDVTVQDWLRVVRRELLMGFCLGSFLGLLGFGAALALSPTVFSALVIPITLLLIVICGTLSGSLLPLLFRRLGLDPALMSTPFVAAIVDIVGILIYLNVALMMLG